MAGLVSVFDRPRDALWAWAGRGWDSFIGATPDGFLPPKYVPPPPPPPPVPVLAEFMGRRILGWDMGQIRNVFFWLGILMVILLFAAVTNPSEASFRNHLTELSFRRHLADIRSSDETPNEDGGDRVEKPSGTETPPIAPFRFANHVAISLRTPHLVYKSFWIYSFASTAPLGPPAWLADPTTKGKSRERIEVYFGFLGHWSVVGILPSRLEWAVRFIMRIHRERRGKKAGSDKAGLLELRAVPPKDEPVRETPKGRAEAASKAANKLLRTSESISSLNEVALPLHGHPPLQPGSRRPSIANLVPPPSPEEPSPLYLSLKTELAAAQSALTDLQSQLSSHEQSISEAHTGLSTTLEELRNKRKEDDAERHELKSRTKSLEDQKRQAEGAKREAEKRLKSVETIRDNLQAKINAAQTRVDDIRAQTEASERAMRVVQEEGAKHVIDTRETVERRKQELEELEVEVAEADARNEELEREVAAAEERLRVAVEAGEAAKHLQPEEEMMMMAAAYEAAAQEGYMYGQQHTSNQFANQAAAYMAEAGMPYLDQNYTARTAPGNTTAATAYGNLTRERRIADVPGFEDFGPGTRRVASNEARPVTPPHSDSESDIYGPHDPGSPNGGISSAFSANLLPQGLFKSLEGDTTPLEEDLGRATLSEALSFEPPHIPASALHEDGSDSGDSGEQLWKTPLTESRVPDHSNHRLSGVRLLPPSTTPPGAVVPAPIAPMPMPTTLPGLPALPPGSRRWFSGTVSAENLAAYNFLHPTTSNDSLNPSLGYDPSPFAPSETEKKALALNWGPLSKYPWARRDPTRSTSAEVAPAPLSSASNTNWLSSRFGHHSASASANANTNGHETKLLEPPEEEEDAKSAATGSSLDKKSFRFFSIRKPKEGSGGAAGSSTSGAGGAGAFGQSWGSGSS